MCKCGVLLSSVVIVSSFILVTSFNLDTFNYAQHKGPDRSMFGFSLAIHKEYGRSWIIVGAPAAQGRQTRIQQGGVVYKCSTTNDDEFDEIIFHEERGPGGRVFDDKNYQWFGATVSSAGPDMPIVACAPRYVWFTLSREERRDPVGTCYIVRNNFRNSSEYSPCRTSLFGYHRQGSCQAGFSAGISKDGKRLFVGAPGSWYWQGQMYSIDPMVRFPYTPGIFGEAFGFNSGSGQVIQQSLDNRPAVMSTPEGPPKDDDSYMGYSMVVGDFNNEGVQGVAVGMPKGGEMLEGKILLYTWSLTNYLNITGEQLGSYFGYALACSDVDGDRRDDLIIGAPLHTESNNENKYEVGRVYVAYQGYDGSFTKKGYLDGINSKSRFGLSLTTLGDLNLDGYGDFAVGAPYDGPSERGAIYIFQGSAEGVIKKYSQVIFAENVHHGSGAPISTFGFSITGGLDLDGNDYPDMAVGAYLSDTAFFFRARPVVKVEAQVKFLAANKQIFLDQKDCSKPGDASVRVTCTHVEVCMKYSGIGTPSRVEMDIQYVLDARKPKYTRMYLGKASGKTVNATLSLYKDAPFNCELRDMVYLEEQIVDKLTELEIEVKYALRESGYQAQPFQRDPRSILVPIVDLSIPAVVNDSISIYRNCGDDNNCIPNLRLIVEKKVDKYKYELGKSLEFLIEVTNHAEDAYNSKFYVHLPNGIGFKVARRTDKSQGKISCSQTFNESIFVCDIGNPLVRDTVVSFKLEVEPLRQQKLLKPTYFFYMNVTSVNSENPEDVWDNKAEIFINVWVNAVLAIEGKSHPVNVYYNTTQYTEPAKTWDTEIGPSVLHAYTVTNKGPANVEEIEVFIIWPLSTLGGEDLLYLLEPPHTLGGVKCEEVDANHKEFTLAVQRGVWETLGIPVPETPGTTSGIHTERNQTRPGEAGNTITKTITTVTFYDISGQKVAEELITGEPAFAEYWQRISSIAKRFTQPLTVQSNSSTIIEKHVNGKVTTQVSTRPLGIPSIPYTSYQIHSNISSTVSYFDASGNLLHKEDISEEPGSVEFRKRVQSSKDRYRIPVTVVTNTTRHVVYSSYDDKLLYQEFLSHSGTDNGSDIKTSTTTLVTNVKLTGPDGKVLHQETVTSEPGSEVYWEHINKIISQYEVPVTIHTTSKKVVTFFVNSVEVNKEEVDVSAGALQPPVMSHTDIKTRLTFASRDGRVLHEDIVADEPGTVSYNDYVNNVISRYREQITITANTTKTIRYRTDNGKLLYTGLIYKYRMETRNPNRPETSHIATVNTVIFYDSNNNILHQETITAEPETAAYWEQINKVISRYQVPVTIHVTVKKYIVYTVDGIEVRREETGGQIAAPDNRFTTHTDTTTTIVCSSADGNILHQDKIRGEIGAAAYSSFVTDIVSRYKQPIVITANMTKTITYRSPDGRIIYTGHIYETKTEHRNSNLNETKRISTITVVTFYGQGGNLLHQETIMDEPSTSVYWEQINKIVSRYHELLTIQANTTKIVTYYIDGREVRTEQISPSPDVVEPRLTTHFNIATTVTCYGSSGNVLYTDTIPGEPGNPSYDNRLASIINSLREPFTLHINIVKTIQYRTSDGRVMHTGSVTQQRSEKHNQSHKETTQQTVTVTTITFYGPDGNILHTETIRDEPGSAIYWDHIKNIIVRFQVPLNIRTNTSKLITYYVNGKETHSEKVEGNAGVYKTFVTHIDIVNVITFYGPDGSILERETVSGELSQADRSEYMARFTRKYRGSFKMEVEITKTISYRASDGRVLHNDAVVEQRPGNTGNNGGSGGTDTVTRTVTETTFTVYGPDRRTILLQETIQGEQGSDAYNRKITEIFNKFTDSVSVHINSTKTVTFYTADGRSLVNQEKLDEPRSTIYRTGQAHSADATTMIAFYGPDGQPIHQDTIHGAPTPELYRQLSELARKYGGVVKSYGGERNEDGSIGGAVTLVDSPYPGNKPQSFGEHFTEFGGAHGGGYNQSSQHNWKTQGNYNYGSGQQQTHNLQDLNQQDLGSYAKGKGFVVGGLDLGTSNSGNVDRYVDGHARNNFDRYSRSEDHNYLAKNDIDKSSRQNHRRHKREEDDTASGIQKLSNCKTSNCMVIRCTTGPVHNGHEVHIALRSRINVLTLKNISTTQPVNIQSMLLARISQFQEISGPPAERTLYRHQVVTSVMAPQPDIKPDIVPLWVVVLSAVAGTLILLLLVFLLYKAGFFQRNRPSDAPERQPLNRNGHFQHGDEAL